ncbi:type 4b pilus protein PilO2 [Salmonella enterica subsp. enterica]|uniref:Pilus assembly protein n=2 Tax=Salmonella enterica TaxID=28901 RepID=A0A5U6HGP9_SALPO|nr:type 4b pilus protein PilO2 [Salmonella enterica]EAA4188427.1 hypothetical protein [Salmonella enterica subsp. enterica serovar Mikawasima]EAC0381161.1 hypothetical protein [Salmonella enterica subsp. enterica serovar Potsdam]EBR8657991.1 hypothetical protein [Salmonella enterica subsp. enterica serovar Kottbus]EBS1713174.1 hypothetical protein [Salmonella enterica subsp. enterica serovar Vitkin]EBS5860737.1 hypothetical protein [Salmonella enterica subsp. enterica serovar Richmond]EBW5295
MAGAIRTCKIRGITFISGLIWESPVDNVLFRENRNHARKENAYYVTRKLGKQLTQLGLVSAEEKNDASVGMCSLAGTLCNIVNVPTWIGAFIVNHQEMALVVVRHGEILAGMDCISSQEVIYDKFMHTIDMVRDAGDDFDKTYCPAVWDIPDSEELSLTSVVTGKEFKKNKSLLRSFSGFDFLKKEKKSILKLVFLFGSVIAGSVGYYSYQYYQQEQEEHRIINTKYIPPPHEWESETSVNEQLNKWDFYLESYPMVFDGWDLKAVSFSRGLAKLTYMRNEMLTASSFGKKAFAYFNVHPVFDKSGNKATLSLLLPADKDVDNKETLLPGQDAEIIFYSYFQRIGVNHIELKKVDVKLPREPVSDNPDVIYKWGKVTWKKYMWTLTVGVPPSVMLYGLKQLPGLRISKIRTEDIDRSTWKLEGEFYANEK